MKIVTAALTASVLAACAFLAGCSARSVGGGSASDDPPANLLLGKWTSPTGNKYDREFTDKDWIGSDGQHRDAVYHIEVEVKEGDSTQDCEFGNSKHMECWANETLFVYNRSGAASTTADLPNPLLGRWSGKEGDPPYPRSGEYTATEWIETNGRRHSVSYQLQVRVSGDENFTCVFSARDKAACVSLSGRDRWKLDRAKQ
jgi:hypothetical protein